MNTRSQDRHSNEVTDVAGQVGWVRLLLGIIIMFVMPAVILFVSSGRLNWGMAWIYIGMTTAFTAVSRILMLRIHPDLAIERAHFSDKSDIKPWDKVLMPLGIIVATAMLIVAGLDRRFEWSPDLPLLIHITAFVISALGFSLSTWATVVNRFFSSGVRIQLDRSHTVVESGPYHLIRHPGYAGTVVSSLATPLLLGSFWALVPASLAVCQLIIRTAMEDRTLQEELEGYRDYAARVRYRLLPGVW